MKNKTKALIAAITLLFILPLTVTPASAMTPLKPRISYGDSSEGILILSGDTSIVLEGQKITFNIIDYPQYDYSEEFESYSSTVITEYSIHNPAESTETLRFALPVDVSLDYGESDPEDFIIALNGEEVEGKTVFYTYREFRGLRADALQEHFNKNALDTLPESGRYDYYPWKVYEISIDKGERAKLSVTAPLYPDVSREYDPETFDYSYWFSFHDLWQGSGSIDIVVSTDYYLFNPDTYGFIKTDKGYSLHYDSFLDQYDSEYIGFTLCSSESPEYVERDSSGLQTLLIILIILIPIILVIKAIVEVVRFILRGIAFVINEVVDFVIGIFKK